MFVPLRIVQLAALLLGATFAQLTCAQAFPSKPLRLIVTYPPAGAVDVVSRAVAGAVSESVGQPVVVENRPGGNTFIGMVACAKSAPDGYTACVTTSDSLSYSPFLFTKVPYDPENDFVGITNLVITKSAIVVGAQLPFNTFKEMIAYSKSNPGKLNFASFGTGSIGHLHMEWFNRELGARITHVPYKGAAQIFPAILSNEVQLTYLGLGVLVPHIKSGKVKALAVTGVQRSLELPNVPTLAEQGADSGLVSYFGLYAPAKTPMLVVERLNAEFVKALRAPKVLEVLASQRFDAVGNTVAEFNRFMKVDRETSGKILALIGIKPQDAPQ